MTVKRAPFCIAGTAFMAALALSIPANSRPHAKYAKALEGTVSGYYQPVSMRQARGNGPARSFVARRTHPPRLVRRPARHTPARAFLASRLGKFRQTSTAQRKAYPQYPWLKRRPGQGQANHTTGNSATRLPYPLHRRWASLAANPNGTGTHGNPPIPAGTNGGGERRPPGEGSPYPNKPGSYWVWWQFHRPRSPAVIMGGERTSPSTSATTHAGAGDSRPPVSSRPASALTPQPSSVAAALLDNKRHRPNELLIEVPNESPDQLKQVLANQYGVEVRELGVIELLNMRFWHLTLVRGQSLRVVLEQLLQDNRVLSVQPNYIYVPVQGVRQGGTPSSYSPAALTTQSGTDASGLGVRIAIIDTCVDSNHTELQGAVTAIFDALPSSGPNECQAENHGTAVASLIGGRGQVQGSATGAALMSARAFATSYENEVTGTSREIALALSWAAKSGARVANLSFAGPSDPLVKRAVAAAYGQGTVLVAAAGNGGASSEPLYPAAYPEVIAVTATDGKRQLYSAANRGPHISVSARGVDVIVAHVSNGYGTESGTSFAAATVSGIVAVMLEKRPKASPDEIRAALQNTAFSVAGKGRNELFGYGLVNVKAAMTFVEANVSQ